MTIDASARLSLGDALLRVFHTATLPGEPCRRLAEDYRWAAELAERVAARFVDEARADERQRCAALLREWATDLWAAPDGAPGYLRATAVAEAADLLDPTGTT